MNRRWFLSRVSALLGAGAAGPVAATVDRSRATIELQRSPVAGFQYHEGEAVWSSLEIGAALRLVREPGNVHDARAVRVEWRRRKLGYVPRVDNAAVCHLLDGGQVLRAEITALCESNDPWQRIEIGIVLE